MQISSINPQRLRFAAKAAQPGDVGEGTRDKLRQFWQSVLNALERPQIDMASVAYQAAFISNRCTAKVTLGKSAYVMDGSREGITFRSEDGNVTLQNRYMDLDMIAYKRQNPKFDPTLFVSEKDMQSKEENLEKTLYLGILAAMQRIYKTCLAEGKRRQREAIQRQQEAEARAKQKALNDLSDNPL